MKETLQERDGWIVIVIESDGYDESKRTRSFYPTGVRAYDFRRDHGEELIGAALRPIGVTGGGYYIGQTRLQIYCRDGGQTLPDVTEVEDIPPPKQRGRALELKYFRGAWHKKTARGWKAA